MLCPDAKPISYHDSHSFCDILTVFFALPITIPYSQPFLAHPITLPYSQPFLAHSVSHLAFSDCHALSFAHCYPLSHAHKS